MTIQRSITTLAVLLALPVAPAFASDDPVALMDDGHYRRAQALVDARAAASPEAPVTLYLLARLKLAAGDFAAALPLAERAAALAPLDADHRYLVAQCVGSMAQRAGAIKGLGLA